MGDFPANGQPGKGGKNEKYEQMEKNNSEVEDWTKQTTNKWLHTWLCFSFHLIFNKFVVKGSICMQSVIAPMHYPTALSYDSKGFQNL